MHYVTAIPSTASIPGQPTCRQVFLLKCSRQGPPGQRRLLPFPSLPSPPLPSPSLLGSVVPPLPPFPSASLLTPDPWKEGCLSCLRNSLPLPYLSASLDLQVANGIGELFSPLTWIACPSMTEWGESGKGELTYLETAHLMTVSV